MIRRTLRLAAHGILADRGTGLNPTLASIADDYDIDAFEVDFTPGSKNLFFGFLPPDSNLSSIAEYPALVMYTTEAEETGDVMPADFSGFVNLHVDAWLKFREGAEQGDTESVCEAVEDAIFTCLRRDTAAWPPGIVPVKAGYRSIPQPITQLEDGWERIIPMEFLFSVTA